VTEAATGENVAKGYLTLLASSVYTIMQTGLLDDDYHPPLALAFDDLDSLPLEGALPITANATAPTPTAKILARFAMPARGTVPVRAAVKKIVPSAKLEVVRAK